MKQKLIGWMMILSFMLTPQISFATTTQVDSLIEKLVEKNILTRSEGIKLKGEIASDAKAIQEESLKTSLPEWVQKMKLKGDFRLRYQWEQTKKADEARNRGRIRYRLGLETEVIKDVKVAVGLATGPNASSGADPRSTNQTFQDTFEKPNIELDYAYAEWQAYKSDTDSVKLIGGVHPRTDYLWNPTDMLWDTDINPQGGAVAAEHKFNSNWSGYASSGVWLLDENSTADMPDPTMSYGQTGLKWKGGKLSSNVAATYYNFNGVKASCPDWSAASNTGITSASNGSCTGALKFDYDSIGASAEFAVDQPFDLPIEQAALFGDYIYNVDSDENNLDHATGYALGFRFGDKKVNGKKQWQAKYIYAYLGKDAWVDFLPDSDRKGGRTDTLAHEAIFEFGLTKNVTVALDYYQARRLKTTKALEHLVQVDLNLKF